MAKRAVQVDITADAKAAVREMDRLTKAAEGTDDALEDTETAGQKMARALDRAASDAVAEIDATKRAVDALDRALGDLDADPRELVADLKRAGLTAQEIEADVDALAKSLRAAGDVKIHAKNLGFDDVDQALGRTTDNSRVASTAIGGIGNSISELPGVGALGPVAESMGMLAENALEGEANLKSLVVAGGGLAAVGLAVGVVQGHFEKLAKIKAWETEQIDTWSDAIYEAGNAVDGLIEAYRNAGQIEVRTLTGGIEDITSTLARAGITVDEWTVAVQGGRAETEELARKLKLAGVEGKQGSAVLQGLALSQKAAGEAARENADRTAVFGSAADEAARDAANLNEELDQVPGEYNAKITADTSAAHRSLDQLAAKLVSLGAQATAAAAAGWFSGGNTNVTVIAPSGANIDDMARRNYRLTGRPV